MRPGTCGHHLGVIYWPSACANTGASRLKFVKKINTKENSLISAKFELSTKFNTTGEIWTFSPWYIFSNYCEFGKSNGLNLCSNFTSSWLFASEHQNWTQCLALWQSTHQSHFFFHHSFFSNVSVFLEGGNYLFWWKSLDLVTLCGQTLAVICQSSIDHPFANT